MRNKAFQGSFGRSPPKIAGFTDKIVKSQFSIFNSISYLLAFFQLVA